MSKKWDTIHHKKDDPQPTKKVDSAEEAAEVFEQADNMVSEGGPVLQEQQYCEEIDLCLWPIHLKESAVTLSSLVRRGLGGSPEAFQLAGLIIEKNSLLNRR